jgi:hypothetical protein
MIAFNKKQTFIGVIKKNLRLAIKKNIRFLSFLDIKINELKIKISKSEDYSKGFYKTSLILSFNFDSDE